MAVTDAQATALRAQLAMDFDEHNRLVDQLDLDGVDRTGYVTLVAAGFFEAVDRRFYKTGTVSDIIAFVSKVRESSEDIADSLDPRAGERMIRHALGDSSHPDFESIADIDDETVRGVQILFLGMLVRDENLDDAGLDAFMTDVRATADRWIARDEAEGPA